MQKIKSLFQRNYESDRKVRNEMVEGSEWVLDGEGKATEKHDGTCCMVRDGKLYRRFDRKVTKQAKRRGKPYTEADCKTAPDGWEPCETTVNEHTGHWPGWLPVGAGPNDLWHREAWDNLVATQEGRVMEASSYFEDGDFDGTYELIGPKVQGNPYNKKEHWLVPHGIVVLEDNPRTFEDILAWLTQHKVEGIVWHHQDGRMVKIKRKDFGLKWPE